MSEFINNHSLRQDKLKEIIMRLHEGEDFETVKAEFQKHFSDISASEITKMETALVREGMPIEHIQKLCDVHASVFKGTIEEIHQEKKDEETPGHPVYTFRQEIAALEKYIDNEIMPLINNYNEESKSALLDKFMKLKEIDKHYARKENLIFPYLEEAGITAPPKVMWGVDDEIRELIKQALNNLKSNLPKQDILESLKLAIDKIKEMIFKDKNILLPMALDTLSAEQWQEVLNSSNEFGYFLIEPAQQWQGPKTKAKDPAKNSSSKSNEDVSSDILFDAGALSAEEANAMLNTLPLDLTFVDKNDRVRYFSQGKERIFPRPKTIIGREVSNCHPPSSVHIVEEIVKDFKSGKKDHEDFWIQMNNEFVYIRYFAVRNKDNEYLGVVELTQNIKHIRELEGEKRLSSNN